MKWIVRSSVYRKPRVTTMGKSPGFWFFTGDWMKDSELRFCSIFARGLLVDLLCLMFEAKQMGFMSTPDGTPRSDEDIVNAVSGSTTVEKLAGLRELEKSGVLSRDSNGVLYSRRLARLGEISKERSKAGSKGGSKTKAKAKQNEQQNGGVTVSDSDSVSVSTLPPKVPQSERVGDEPKIPKKLDTDRFKKAFSDWQSVIAFESANGKAPNSISLQTTLEKLASYPERKACGFILAWIDKRRIYTDWKADWEHYQPEDKFDPFNDTKKYAPRPKVPSNGKQ